MQNGLKVPVDRIDTLQMSDQFRWSASTLGLHVAETSDQMTLCLGQHLGGPKNAT